MEGLIWLLIYAGLFYFMMRYGCGAHMIHGHGGHGGHNDTQQANTQIDPVCGMKVAEDQGYGKMYQGSLYRFCSRKCLDQFEEKPNLYAQQSGIQTGGKS